MTVKRISSSVESSETLTTRKCWVTSVSLSTAHTDCATGASEIPATPVRVRPLIAADRLGLGHAARRA